MAQHSVPCTGNGQVCGEKLSAVTLCNRSKNPVCPAEVTIEPERSAEISTFGHMGNLTSGSAADEWS